MQTKKVYLNVDFNELELEEESGSYIIKKLEPRVMDLLLLFLENKRQLVSRDHIIDKIWNNFEGADESLNQAISILRKNLGDKDLSNRIIKTIPKKGYILFDDQLSFIIKKNNHSSENLSANAIPTIKKSHVLIGILIIIIMGFLWSHYSNNQNKPETVIRVGKPS